MKVSQQKGMIESFYDSRILGQPQLYYGTSTQQSSVKGKISAAGSILRSNQTSITKYATKRCTSISKLYGLPAVKKRPKATTRETERPHRMEVSAQQTMIDQTMYGSLVSRLYGASSEVQRQDAETRLTPERIHEPSRHRFVFDPTKAVKYFNPSFNATLLNSSRLPQKHSEERQTSRNDGLEAKDTKQRNSLERSFFAESNNSLYLPNDHGSPLNSRSRVQAPPAGRVESTRLVTETSLQRRLPEHPSDLMIMNTNLDLVEETREGHMRLQENETACPTKLHSRSTTEQDAGERLGHKQLVLK